MTMTRDQILTAARALPPLPPTSVRLAGMLSGGDWDLDEVEEVLGYDPVVAARLVALANSALSSPIRQIETVGEAFLRLGAGQTLSLVVSCQVAELCVDALAPYGMRSGGLWRHSVASSIAATACCARLPQSPPIEAITAALLHGMGKLVVGILLPDRDVQGFRVRIDAGEDECAVERDFLGFDHAEIGSWVTECWGLPNSISEAIARHREPTDETGLAVDLVHAAQKIATWADLDEEARADLDESVRERLGLGTDEVPEIVHFTRERLREVLSRYASSSARGATENHALSGLREDRS